MKIKSLLLAITFFAGNALAAGPDLTVFQNWAKSAKVSGYVFSGAEESDPGVYMAIWMNPKGETIGVHLAPAAGFSHFAPTKKQAVHFTYKGLPAQYTDAAITQSGLAVKYEKQGKMLSVSHLLQKKAMSKDELIAILDAMKPEILLK